jgi:hypothetical protein
MRVLFVLALCVAMVVAGPVVWPKKYMLEANFKLPYANITEPVRVFFDAENQREKIEYYNGLDSFLYRFDMQNTYEIFTKIDHQECLKTSGNGSLVTLLPDLSTWDYKGQILFRNLPCEHYQYVNKAGSKVNTYDFYYVTDADVPVRFEMIGYNIVWGSHYDHYIVDFGLYLPGVDVPGAFDPPALCKGAAEGSRAAARRGMLQLTQLYPSAAKHEVYDEFEQYVGKFGQACTSSDDCNAMLRTFQTNTRLIAEHNARDDVSYEMSINHFAHMSYDDFSDLMLPSKGKFVYHPENKAKVTHVPGTNGAAPASIDWRSLGGVTQVKDQGACGSCWSFSAVGALEGAHFAKHKKLISMSEQHLVDCAWNYGKDPYGNNGCDGGLPFLGMEYIMDAGGIDTEEFYPYLMQDSYCRFSKDHIATSITGYGNVTVGDEAALADAVSTYGPISVAIDVTESMVFYGSGVYYEPACKSDFADLNHGVLVVGYGSNTAGQDYWIVKNSWSTYWGDEGYILMARNKGNNCGIATAAVYALIE